MTIDQLLDDLHRAGVTLFVDGGRLRYRGPAGGMTTELRGAVAACRSEILMRLDPLAHATPAKASCKTCDPSDWIDAQPNEGRVRTTCGQCGRFIGYRPQAP